MPRVNFCIIAAALLMLSSAAPLPLAAQNSDPSLGSISGTVIDTSGEPIRKALATLKVADQYTNEAQRGEITTNRDGRFVFTGLTAGTYELRVNHPQYVTSASNTPVRITVPKGESVSVTITLTPQAVISGRVIDEDGDPIDHAAVELLVKRVENGHATLVPQIEASTNDVGEFRIAGISRGRYLIRVIPQLNMPGRVIDLSRPHAPRAAPPKSEMFGYQPTFYPGTNDVGKAVEIPLRPGSDMRNVNFQLHRSHVYQISGKVTESSGEPCKMVMLRLLSGADGGLQVMVSGANAEGDGEFVMDGISPGRYDLTAIAIDPFNENTDETKIHPRFAQATITVIDQDITGLELVAGVNTLKLRAKVSVEGAPPESFSKMHFTLAPADVEAFEGLDIAAPDAHGNIEFQNVPTGRVFLLANEMPDGFYLKSVIVAGKDVRYSGFELRPGSTDSPFDIVIARDVATVRGAAVRAGTPMPNAQVFLIPKGIDAGLWSILTGTHTDQKGRFTIRGVAPGEYAILALDAETLQEAGTGEALHKYAKYAMQLSVKPNETRELTIEVPPEAAE